MNELKQIFENNKRIIGMWGYPQPDVLENIKNQYPGHYILDLDVNYKAPPANILPDAYCKIITNIINNSVFLKNNIDVIVASVGEEKCDSGRLAAILLEDMGFNIIQTRFFHENADNASQNKEIITPISESNIPLKDKISKIMDGIINPINISLEKSVPSCGFWGVPPNDFSILELFPDSTHVFGWVKCVEAKRPADIDLEMSVNPSLPTVFFAQTFCAKMQIAKYLAGKYNGLYVDVDDTASNSVKAKIEAFIRLG